MELTVDTSYWTRYRSDSQNPDLGDTLPQAVPGLAAGKYPAIPRSNDDLRPGKHLQAIANTISPRRLIPVDPQHRTAVAVIGNKYVSPN